MGRTAQMREFEWTKKINKETHFVFQLKTCKSFGVFWRRLEFQFTKAKQKHYRSDFHKKLVRARRAITEKALTLISEAEQFNSVTSMASRFNSMPSIHKSHNSFDLKFEFWSFVGGISIIRANSKRPLNEQQAQRGEEHKLLELGQLSGEFTQMRNESDESWSLAMISDQSLVLTDQFVWPAALVRFSVSKWRGKRNEEMNHWTPASPFGSAENRLRNSFRSAAIKSLAKVAVEALEGKGLNWSKVRVRPWTWKVFENFSKENSKQVNLTAVSLRMSSYELHMNSYENSYESFRLKRQLFPLLVSFE